MSAGIQAAALSHPGRVRALNEDSVLVDPGCGLLIVADGMGGHQAGEVASRLAVEAAVAVLRPVAETPGAPLEPALRQAVQAADRAVASAASDPALQSMGTTLVLAVCRPGMVHIAHVGDSRAYLWHGGVLDQLTSDHSLVEHMVRQGEITPADALHHPMRNVLVRSIGNKNNPEPDIAEVGWAPGDLLLLCTDGLTNMVDESRIRKILAGGASLQAMCERLVREANHNGGKDNVTAVIAATQ